MYGAPAIYATDPYTTCSFLVTHTYMIYWVLISLLKNSLVIVKKRRFLTSPTFRRFLTHVFKVQQNIMYVLNIKNIKQHFKNRIKISRKVLVCVVSTTTGLSKKTVLYIAVPVISWCSRSITCKGRSKKHCKRGREVGKTWHQNSDACRHITHCTKHQKKIHLFWGIAHYLVFLHYFSNFETLSGLMKVRALYENGWYQKEKVDV